MITRVDCKLSLCLYLQHECFQQLESHTFLFPYLQLVGFQQLITCLVFLPAIFMLSPARTFFVPLPGIFMLLTTYHTLSLFFIRWIVYSVFFYVSLPRIIILLMVSHALVSFFTSTLLTVYHFVSVRRLFMLTIAYDVLCFIFPLEYLCFQQRIFILLSLFLCLDYLYLLHKKQVARY